MKHTIKFLDVVALTDLPKRGLLHGIVEEKQ